MTALRAILHGGPVHERVIDDVPEETETVKIPSNSNTKYALYQRVGDGRDGKGPFLRFDFIAVHDADGRPMTDW
jgi:hypothetical protein